MPTDASAFLQAFKAGLKEEKKQRKSNEILDFIVEHPLLFCSSKAVMNERLEEIRQQDDYNVTALADVLGLPDYVLFKKVKVVDTAKTFLHSTKSPLFKLYIEQLDKRRKRPDTDPPLCIIMVAGEHTMIISNVGCQLVPGIVNMIVPGEGSHADIHMFTAKEAPLRMPKVFNHKEFSYE